MVQRSRDRRFTVLQRSSGAGSHIGTGAVCAGRRGTGPGGLDDVERGREGWTPRNGAGRAGRRGTGPGGPGGLPASRERQAETGEARTGQERVLRIRERGEAEAFMVVKCGRTADRRERGEALACPRIAPAPYPCAERVRPAACHSTPLWFAGVPPLASIRRQLRAALTLRHAAESASERRRVAVGAGRAAADALWRRHVQAVDWCSVAACPQNTDWSQRRGMQDSSLGDTAPRRRSASSCSSCRRLSA
jgi:hypothetical protein